MMQASAAHPSSGVHPPANPTISHLAAQVVLRFLAMTLVITTLLFLPASTVRWWQGWAFLAALILPSFACFLYFLKTDPQLIERRLPMKERVRAQKPIVMLGYLSFAGVLTVPGFDHRLGWSQRWLGAEPLALEVFSLVMVPLAMLAIAWGLRTNRYAGRTICVEEGQKAITTGPYRIVRHPMYAFSIVMWAFLPLTIGSYVMLLAIVITLPFYVLRILNEEKVLRAELAGYSEYCEKTRWRLVPLVW